LPSFVDRRLFQVTSSRLQAPTVDRGRVRGLQRKATANHHRPDSPRSDGPHPVPPRVAGRSRSGCRMIGLRRVRCVPGCRPIDERPASDPVRHGRQRRPGIALPSARSSVVRR